MNAINLDYLMRRAENRETLGSFEAEQLIRLCRRMEAHAQGNPLVTWWTFVEEERGGDLADDMVVLYSAKYFVTAGMIRRWLREAPFTIAPGVLLAPHSKSEAKRIGAQAEPVARVIEQDTRHHGHARAIEPMGDMPAVGTLLYSGEPAPMPSPVVEAFAQVERAGAFDGAGASGNWDASPSSTDSYSSGDSGSSSSDSSSGGD